MFNPVLRQFLSPRSWNIATISALFVLTFPPLFLPLLAQTSVPDPNITLTETEYTLGAGDRLKIDVFQVQEFSGEYLVLVDSTVSLPLLGTVRVQGLTLSEMSKLLSQRYSSYLKRPIVTVGLLAPRPLKIAVSGEVNSPGAYTLAPSQTQKFPSVTDLIKQAGGLTTVADISQVELRRFFQGKQQILRLNLWELLQQGDLSQDITLRDGDTIFIPTKDRIDPGEIRQLADVNFGVQANQEINVVVVGEVNRPGAYKVKPDQLGGNSAEQPRRQPPRLTQGIQLAGGIKPLADIRQIEVHRFNRDGSQQKIDINLWTLLQTGDIKEDVILQDGDTIIIPTAQAIPPTEAEPLASASFAPATIRVNVVGEVKKAGMVEVPPNTPLNQALLASGGFDDRRANKGSVDLIRLNPDGTVVKQEIEIDFAAGINEQNNPLLRNNDVIVVDRSGLTKVTDALSTVLSPLGSAFGFLNIFRIFN